MFVRIYHNPNCSKSRQALSYLRDKSDHVEVIEYLKNPLKFSELEELLDLLGGKPREIMRQNEQAYREAGLSDSSLSKKQLIEAIVDYPIILQRPIVVKDNKAIVARPVENLKDFIF